MAGETFCLTGKIICSVGGDNYLIPCCICNFRNEQSVFFNGSFILIETESTKHYIKINLHIIERNKYLTVYKSARILAPQNCL